MSSTVWISSAPAAEQARQQQGLGEWLALAVTAAAVLYNFALCFVNTRLYGITPDMVIASEIVLIVIAFALIWNRSPTLYLILLLVAAYFYVIMIFRSQFDPKVVRDILIPIIFFFLGRHLGTPRSADRLVTFLILIAFGAALFEWLTLDAYVRYFDVGHYYMARGTILQELDRSYDDFFNSTRFDGRTLLPFIGEHRVSSIFLEAPSVGNFGAIAFAWLLLCSKRDSFFVVKVIMVAMLIVLADARFGLYFCCLILMIYATNMTVRPTMLFVAPFVAMIAMMIYAGVGGQDHGNDMLGRLFHAGKIISSIDAAQLFGLRASDIASGVQFASDPINDSAYTYVAVEIGLVGASALWALFIYSPVSDKHARHFKIIIALYYIFLLTISASPFTIKTAALLWFLYGTLNGRNQGTIGYYLQK